MFAKSIEKINLKIWKMQPGKSSFKIKNMEIKKTGNCDFKIFQNESKKIRGPFWKFCAKSFQMVKKTWKKFFRMEKYPK